MSSLKDRIAEKRLAKQLHRIFGSRFGLGFVRASSPYITFSFNGQFTANSATAQTTKTFTSVGLGTATSDRMVVVGLSYRYNVTTNSVTVNGVSATRVNGTSSSTGSRRIEMWRAAVPSGTSVTVTATFSGSVTGEIVITTHSVYNLVSQTPSANNVASTSSGTSINTTMNTVLNGIGIGVGMHDNDGSNSTWTNLTETNDQALTGAYQHTTAALTPTETVTPLTVTLAQAGAANDINMVIAHWN